MSEILTKFALDNNKFAKMENLNRINAVLVETHRTNKWLAGQMGIRQQYRSGVLTHHSLICRHYLRLQNR